MVTRRYDEKLEALKALVRDAATPAPVEDLGPFSSRFRHEPKGLDRLLEALSTSDALLVLDRALNGGGGE